MKVSLWILIALSTTYFVASLHMITDWVDQRKLEKKIYVSLENFLALECKRTVNVNGVKVNNIPWEFFGVPEQEWSAEYDDGQPRVLHGTIYDRAAFYISDVPCSPDSTVSLNKDFVLDIKNSTFVEDYMEGTETGLVGVKEIDIFLMKFFGVVILFIFILSATIELLYRIITSKRKRRKRAT